MREWAGGSVAQWVLRPLSWLYAAVLAWRTRPHGARPGGTRSGGLPVPLVVVGNLTAGGSGKTPCLLALAAALVERGWRPGVISRGYGGRGRIEPVTAASTAASVGDEPVLIARRLGLPVWVGRDRRAAAHHLLAAHSDVDVLLSDDGLQHQSLPRDVEIVVVDARRGFGNARLLPAGPLREPVTRLSSVDQVWLCGDGPLPDALAAGGMPPPIRVRLALATYATSLARPGDRRLLADFVGRKVTAVAAIAAPERFFAMLDAIGIDPLRRAWPDHHLFQPADLADLQGQTVLMTQKDAVKCETFAAPDWWAAPLEATLPADAVDAVERALRDVRDHPPAGA